MTESTSPESEADRNLAHSHPSTTQPTALLGSQDLMLYASLAGSARKHGWQLTSCRTWEDILCQCAQELVRLLLLDLTQASLELNRDRVAVLRSWGVHVVAFGPHVHRDKLEHARGCGCDEVISRGELHLTADRIFTSLKT